MLITSEMGHRFTPRPKKRFGQHFLSSPTILAGILQLAELAPDDVVVEIGAGTGTLTEALASRVGRLLALELDRDLIAPLRQRFADRPQVEMHPPSTSISCLPPSKSSPICPMARR